jgi:tryptophanyl-tRNA synthetase
MTRVLSGIQPTGETHLGNYLGAIRNWVDDQHEHDAFYCVVDLHAITIPQDPAELRAKTLSMAMLLLAAGLDPDVCTIFVQSHVAEHSQLGWIMECTAAIGELQRMTQFKDKAAKQAGFVSAGLLTYPALQAADILLYDADRVPVGDDQRQHLELTRDLAIRFNHRYGDVFVVPEHAIPKAGARVMDLQEPTAKMSKSSESPQGTVLVLDPPEVIVRKFKRAVTDSGSDVVYDPVNKPGVSNLLSILGAATGTSPEAAASGFAQYGPLKAATGEAVAEVLRPLQQRYAELAADPAETSRLLAVGAEKARSVAAKTLARARDALGFLAPG